MLSSWGFAWFTSWPVVKVIQRVDAFALDIYLCCVLFCFAPVGLDEY